MGRHMKTIGQQCHGTGDVTGGNLANHHDEGQRHYPQRAAGVFIMGAPRNMWSWEKREA